MHNNPKFFKTTGLIAGLVMFYLVVDAAATPLKQPSRLDLYDASDNHLMYLTFNYDGSNRCVRRTVYMADSTFMRRVEIFYSADGRRSTEVSYNFNDDTSWVMTYQQTPDATGFSITDNFKVDWVGGNVTYSMADPLRFELKYQNTGKTAAKMNYQKDGIGNLVRVDVTDQNGVMQYYGVFSTEGVGVIRAAAGAANLPQATVTARGGLVMEVQFNLRTAGEVRCDLVTLSGRCAATLLRTNLQPGAHTQSIRRDHGALRGVAGGVYVVTVSVDGVTVVRSRYLHQNQGAGGVR